MTERPPPIPLSRPDIGPEEIEAVERVLRSGRLSIGPEQEAFEEEFAAVVGTRHAVALASGTAALHLTLLGYGIGAGDEVIVPTFTFIAPVSAVRYVGARPVLVDARVSDLNLDPEAVERAIGRRTRAIVAVHVFGVPAAVEQLRAIADRHGLLLIEDACEALGGSVDGRRLGSWGDAGVFGFYPNKQITTGEGGMVATDDATLAATVRRLRNHGRDSGQSQPHHVLGYNQRLAEIPCAIGRVQLRRLPEFLKARAAAAAAYHERFRTLDDWQPPPPEGEREQRSWFVYVVRLTGATGQGSRDRIHDALLDEGIGCGRYFPPVHLEPCWEPQPGTTGSFPVAEDAARRTLALPFHGGLTGAEIDRVCERLEFHRRST